MNRGRQPLRVLVVDRSETTRTRLGRMLAELDGVDVHEAASDQASALNAYQEVHPACLVVDVPVHDSRGFEMLGDLRRRGADCTIVVLTNHLSPELVRRCMSSGADHFLAKWSEFERVIDIVHDLAEERP